MSFVILIVLPPLALSLSQMRVLMCFKIVFTIFVLLWLVA